MSEGLLTTADAATLCGVSKNTILRAVATGQLRLASGDPSSRGTVHGPKYARADVLALKSAATRPPLSVSSSPWFESGPPDPYFTAARSYDPSAVEETVEKELVIV